MEKSEDNLQSVVQNFSQSADVTLNNNSESADNLYEILPNLLTQELFTGIILQLTNKCHHNSINNAINCAIKFKEDLDKDSTTDFSEKDIENKVPDIIDIFCDNAKTSELLEGDSSVEPNIIEEGSIVDIINSMFRHMGN